MDIQPEPEYLFVYGTLLRDVSHPKSDILEKYARNQGRRIFRGRLYDVGSYPAAIASNNKNDKIFGDLYELLRPQAALKKLDAYEGYFPENNTASFYIRTKETVYHTDGKHGIKSWIYLYNKSIEGLRPISSGDYLAYLQSISSSR